MESIKKLKERVLELNKLEAFKCRDSKLPFMKRIGYRIFGWCSDTVAESLWESNQMLSVILDELISQYELLLTEVKKIELECGEIRKDAAVSANERKQLKAHTEASEKLINDLLVQVKDIQVRENWTRERFEGQDKRLESGEVFQDWARERFEGQDKKFASAEEFQNWTRSRFEGHDERFTGIEERETWTRERFEGQDKKFASVEEFQNWARGRFEGQDDRFTGIEEREAWTRERFESQDKKFASVEEFQNWARNRFDGQDERFAGIEEREAWTRERFEDQDKKFASMEEFQNWARGRFDGQDERFVGIEEREAWTRERFEDQDKKFASVEEFQNWARGRFDGQDERFAGIEEREAWTRTRFEGHDEKFVSVEEFQNWARGRFDGHDERFAGIEEREAWTRERFNEAFDRLWRLDEITNYSVKKEILKVPVVDKNDIVMSRIMLNNRMFWMAAYKNAQDDISESVREGRLSCGNSELLHVFDKPGTFLDLGANIGAFSLGFASQGWKGIAFEAGSKNYELLKQSIDKNGFEIQLFNKAVHSATGTLCFNEEGPWGRVVTDDNQALHGDCIEALALDDFIKDAKSITESIDLIKMDIEGSEVAAIRGMGDFLKSYAFPAVYAECNAYALSLQEESPLSLYEAMKELGYQPYCYEYGNIYSFDLNEFQMEYCVDRLFIHSNHIGKFKIEKKAPLTEEEIKDNIINHLKELLKEDSDSEGRISAHHNYVCSLLKHYPKLYADEEIRGLLKCVLNTRTKDTYLMNALEWFEDMER